MRWSSPTHRNCAQCWNCSKNRAALTSNAFHRKQLHSSSQPTWQSVRPSPQTPPIRTQPLQSARETTRGSDRMRPALKTHQVFWRMKSSMMSSKRARFRASANKVSPKLQTKIWTSIRRFSRSRQVWCPRSITTFSTWIRAGGRSRNKKRTSNSRSSIAQSEQSCESKLACSRHLNLND